MKKEIGDLQEYLKKVAGFSLPKYKELPSVELYMEQVLNFINGALADLTPAGEKALTSFMVNNYVKAKMISTPTKKKYSRDQIGYLIAICLMKSTLSMGDIAVLLEHEAGISVDKERVYSFFCELETAILAETAKKTAPRVDEVARRLKIETSRKNKHAEDNAINSLALLALRLSIQAQANKLLSDYIIDVLRKSSRTEEAYSIETYPSNKEAKHEAALGKVEAKRLAEAKQTPKPKKDKKSKKEKKA